MGIDLPFDMVYERKKRISVDDRPLEDADVVFDLISAACDEYCQYSYRDTETAVCHVASPVPPAPEDI